MMKTLYLQLITSCVAALKQTVILTNDSVFLQC